MKKSERFEKIKDDIQKSSPSLCPERAYLVTRFMKEEGKKIKNPPPPPLRSAKATHYILSNMTPTIYPHELIVGSLTTRRVGAPIYPELAGVPMMEELWKIDRRETNPLKITLKDKLTLMTRVIPYWVNRDIVARAFPTLKQRISYTLDQLNAKFYIINEAGGISHFAPDYSIVIRRGIDDLIGEVEERRKGARGAKGEKREFYRAQKIALEGVLALSENYARRAQEMAGNETDPERKGELEEISQILKKVPRHPAETFREALQSLWITHIAINAESLNIAIAPGRMDQYLYPFYKGDIEKGRMTREGAKELLLLFSAKASEHIPLLSSRVTKYHGGFIIGQTVIVGGVDRDGNDATNELSHVFLDVMEESGMREPNYHARLHLKSPEEFTLRVMEVASSGNGVPAIYNDEAIIPALTAIGIKTPDARDYATVGCVEPVPQGKSFNSTDAGLFNLPIIMEMALNNGKLFNGKKYGLIDKDADSPPQFRDIDDVIGAFEAQLDYMVKRMVDDFHHIERSNAENHPIPLSSVFVGGCLESGTDLTRGGATYNSSGVQGVGIADVADSLSAIDSVVFQEKRGDIDIDIAMAMLIDALKDDFKKYGRLHTELSGAPRYGNDNREVDRYARLVVQMWHDALARHTNTRGGRYIPGFYSMTCHLAFGEKTGALPSGRHEGMPFASGLAPVSGMDRLGPTALLQSVSKIDPIHMPNGSALNLKFSKNTLKGDDGSKNLKSLITTFFEMGGMQVQINAHDPEILLLARDNPEMYPGLVVRISGYCAYFNDLSPRMKEEIIKRTGLEL